MNPLRFCAIALTFAAFIAPFNSPSVSAKALITKFDPPDSVRAFVAGINDSGAIAGDYLDSLHRTHGFVRAPDGTITTFDEPAAGKKRVDCTCVRGMNNAGDLTGYYTNQSKDAALHAYVRAADGTFIEFDVPDSIRTVGIAINAEGAVAGYYNDAAATAHGFLRGPAGDFTTFDPPKSEETIVTGINDGGAITGWYSDPKGRHHGFVRTADGAIATFDAPGAVGTFASGINRNGTVVGYYDADDQTQHAFTRAADGTIATYDVEGAEHTIAESIGARQMATGEFSSGSAYLGYTRSENGRIRTFAAPHSIWTIPESINVNGDVAGEAYNTDFHRVHGFIRIR